MAKCALEDAGIEALSQADTAGGMREHLAWSGAGFKIFVREEDVAAARELLSTPFKAEEGSEADFGDDGGLIDLLVFGQSLINAFQGLKAVFDHG